jgi:hypothetical protein
MTRGTGGANGAPPTETEQRDSAPARSWSQYNSFRNCPRSWWLAKVRRVKRRPGVWFPAGTAVQQLEAQLAAHA